MAHQLTAPRSKVLKHNVKQFLISLDQTAGCFIAILSTLASYLIPSIPYWCAWADETMSALAHRWHANNVRYWPKKTIDTLFWFDKNHCEESYNSEKMRTQSPPECRIDYPFQETVVVS